MNLPRRAYGPPTSLQRQGSGLGLFLLLLFSGLVSPAAAQCPDEIEVLQPISCSGADDGVLTVALSDGVDGADVYWLIEGDTLFGAVQSGLGPGSYLAFASLVSALTKNQVLAFVVTLVLLLVNLTIGFPGVADWLSGVLPAFLHQTIKDTSFLVRFDAISRGVLDLRDVLFFLSSVALCLFANAAVVDLRKGA